MYNTLKRKVQSYAGVGVGGGGGGSVADNIQLNCQSSWCLIAVISVIVLLFPRK